MNRKISIIIPVYGVEPYIEDCLKSVASQDYEGELECVVVDDRGPDRSMEIVQRYIDEYQGPVNFKICTREKNGGLSAARNSGIKVATGDYVYLLDSDDEITPDCISSLTKPLDTGSYDFIIGDYRTAGTDRQFQKLTLDDNSILEGWKILKEYVSGSWYQMAVNKLYNVDFLRRNNLQFEEGLIHEDELWSFQMACVANSMFAVRKELYIYKIRENSITTNINYERKAKAFARIYLKGSDIIRQQGLNKNYYAFIWATSMFGLTLKMSSNYDSSNRKECYDKLHSESAFKIRDVLRLKPFSIVHIFPRLFIVLPYVVGNPFLKIQKN